MADVTTMKDLLKLQQEANELLAKRLEPMRVGKLPSADDLVADQVKDIARLKATLENAVKQRETVVKNLDDRIDRLRARVEKLSKERKQADDVLQRAKKDADTKRDTDKKPTPPKKRPPNT